MFVNPVSIFVLLEFRLLDNITVCILILSFCLGYLMRLPASFQVALWTCFWSLSLFVFQSHKTFHVEEPRRTQQVPQSLLFKQALLWRIFIQLVMWLAASMLKFAATSRIATVSWKANQPIFNFWMMQPFTAKFLLKLFVFLLKIPLLLLVSHPQQTLH